MSNARRTIQKQVHYAAHEQKRHQRPATADAVCAVAEREHYATRHVPPKAAVTDQERKPLLAFGKTDVLEPSPLMPLRTLFVLAIAESSKAVRSNFSAEVGKIGIRLAPRCC